MTGASEAALDDERFFSPFLCIRFVRTRLLLNQLFTCVMVRFAVAASRLLASSDGYGSSLCSSHHCNEVH